MTQAESGALEADYEFARQFLAAAVARARGRQEFEIATPLKNNQCETLGCGLLIKWTTASMDS